ncbi:MAG: hypothetical protein LC130_16485 [Bryobacterales bacterium]|nr:hypothetical protein [Bryobacterales bacterium]
MDRLRAGVRSLPAVYSSLRKPRVPGDRDWRASRRDGCPDYPTALRIISACEPGRGFEQRQRHPGAVVLLALRPM